MKHIKKCKDCGNYTLKDLCPCGSATTLPKPPKYSPDDKYAEYRRIVKEPEWTAKGYI
jgi:H/ACA ribonucleoprotein complex subunit 3